MKTNKKKSCWHWYAVKLLFESIITGEPNKEKIDANFSNEFKMYEEQFIVVKAQSSDHAYKIANREAVKSEMEYKTHMTNWLNVDLLIH